MSTPSSAVARPCLSLPGLSAGQANTVGVARKRKGLKQRHRHQTAAVWLVLGLTVLVGGVQLFWRYPSGWWLYLYHFPSVLLCPFVLAAGGLSLRSRHGAPTAVSVLVLGCLLGPIMGLGWGAGRAGADVGDQTQPPDQIRVISLNAQSWSAALYPQAKRLARLGPDVLLFQEMWDLKHLASARGVLPRFLFRGDARGYDGVAIGTHFPLSGVLRPPPANVLANLVDLDGRQILLVTVHGRKRGGFLPEDLQQSLELQHQQCRELLAYIDSFGLPVILGGDLNSPPYAPLSLGLRAQLKDSFHQVGVGYGYTFPTLLPVIRIDGVFVSPELGAIVSCRTVDVGSDHLAVVVDIEVRPQTESAKARNGGQASESAGHETFDHRRSRLHRFGGARTTDGLWSPTGGAGQSLFIHPDQRPR